MYSTIPQPGQPVPAIASSIYLPLADCSVRAGFPSPAEDFTGKRLDLSAMLVEHPQATFVLRVAGTSMVEHGIGDGDMIVVDRSIQARHGHIVVAVIEGEFTVKSLYSVGGIVRLKAGNPTYLDIIPRECETLQIWGVVTACIKRFSR